MGQRWRLKIVRGDDDVGSAWEKRRDGGRNGC